MVLVWGRGGGGAFDTSLIQSYIIYATQIKDNQTNAHTHTKTKEEEEEEGEEEEAKYAYDEDNFENVNK